MTYSDREIFDTLARFFAQDGTGREGMIAVRSALPRGSTGKVDRMQLRADLSHG